MLKWVLVMASVALGGETIIYRTATSVDDCAAMEDSLKTRCDSAFKAGGVFRYREVSQAAPLNSYRASRRATHQEPSQPDQSAPEAKGADKIAQSIDRLTNTIQFISGFGAVAVLVIWIVASN
jgi:hypothetical protein